MQRKVLYILNLYSNKGESKKLWDLAAAKYKSLPKEPFILGDPEVLRQKILEEKPEIVAIAGGDGSINSVASVIYKLENKPTIAVIPVGFGNAFSYCIGVDTVEKAVETIQNSNSKVMVDLLKTNLTKFPIGILNISCGFDARVVHNNGNFRYIGHRAYLYSGINSFIYHPEKEMEITIDNTTTLKTVAASIIIANSPALGKNLIISSTAKLNDGFLDCTIFSSKVSYLTNIRPRGIKHPLYSNTGKIFFKAKHIAIRGEPFAQVDGDPITLSKDLEVSIDHNAIEFLCNEKGTSFDSYDPFI